MSNMKSESDQIAFALPHRPSPKVDPIIFGESLTEQSHKESCDINNIIEQRLDNFDPTNSTPDRLNVRRQVAEARIAHDEL